MLKLRTDPSTRRRGTVAAVATAAALATLVSAAPSAVAADPSTKFTLEFGASRTLLATPYDDNNVDANPWPDFPLRATAGVHLPTHHHFQ